jgi:hypothetical protein
MPSRYPHQCSDVDTTVTVTCDWMPRVLRDFVHDQPAARAVFGVAVGSGPTNRSPTALAVLGSSSEDAAKAAERVARAAAANPCPVGEEEARLSQLAAHEGVRLASSREEFRP